MKVLDEFSVVGDEEKQDERVSHTYTVTVVRRGLLLGGS